MPTGPIRLYVSSSPDLYVEREIVGQVIAELPLTIGWRIGHTPVPGSGGEDTVVHAEECNIYALMLGADFAAPMGAELRQAVLAGRALLAFRKECMRSPSAQDALRRVQAQWHAFAAHEAFRGLFEEELLHVVLGRAVELGLGLDELERLTRLAQDIGESRAKRTDAGRRGSSSGDVDRGGVIIGREVWQGGPPERA